MHQNGLGYISDTYPNLYPPVTVHPCKAYVTLISQRQSITQKGVHARSLTAREREHWFLRHLSHFIAVNFGRQ